MFPALAEPLIKMENTDDDSEQILNFKDVEIKMEHDEMHEDLESNETRIPIHHTCNMEIPELEKSDSEKQIMKCFWCQESNSVKAFNSKTLAKCKDALQLKLTLKNNQQLQYIVLPESVPNNSIGYHSKPCYANFTSIQKKYKVPEIAETNKEDDEIKSVPDFERSNEVDQQEQNSSQISEPECQSENCIFCSQVYKRLKKAKRYEKLTYTNEYCTFDLIKNYATKYNDINLLLRVAEKIDKNNRIAYHKHCKSHYCVVHEAKSKEKTEWHEKRYASQHAFKQLTLFITDYVIIHKNPCSMHFIKKVFMDLLLAEYNNEFNEKIFNVNHIPRKVETYFYRKVKIINKRGEKIVAPINSNVDMSFDDLKTKDIIQEAALHLRKIVLQIKPKKLGNDITALDLIRGECKLPEELIQFYKTLLSGFNSRRRKSDKTMRLTKSFSADLIYAVTNGQVKPAKSITLGSAIKSLTSSKKVVKVLHAYGHICSYEVLQGLETEATYTVMKSDSLCPSDMKRTSGLRTSTAFGNFDRFIETTSGKVTLNDTVGIAIQDAVDSDSTENITNDALLDSMTENVENPQNNIPDGAGKPRRRSYKGAVQENEPYTKKPRIMETIKPSDFHLRHVIPDDLKSFKELDATWVLSHFCNIRTPMWIGFNSKLIPNINKKQLVSYLTPINKSPTDRAVVIETMRRAKIIAEECNEQYAQVSYDLGIANIAMKLKSEEKHEFKNLFIHLGIFHITMSFFKAIGSFLDGCGLTTIMVEVGLIGSGSVNTFLNGKHFHRCKRLHCIVALALQMREFKYFTDKKNVEINTEVMDYLKQLQCKPLDEITIQNEYVRSIIQQFLSFHQEILAGAHGKTMQFYAIYIQLINYYFLLERSMRMTNLQLFKYVLAKINNIFFTFNHTNYSRYLAWYTDALISIDDNYPGLSKDVMISVKRTEKSFSSIPIDLTLKQTINADAARRSTGIMHLTNSISARIRWSLNHGLRSSIISYVLEESMIKRSQDISNDLFSNRINKSKIQIDAFNAALDIRMNPFDPNANKDLLLNISTGQAAPIEVAQFLLDVENIGETLRNNFIDKCAENPENFDSFIIKKNKILNFQSCLKKQKLKISGKVQEVKLQRDLFGRLIGISLDRKIDIEKILSFPLTPVPLALCHLDGTIVNTNKAVLTGIIERQIENHGAPEAIDILLIDGFFLLRTMANLPQKFGDVAMDILKRITSDVRGNPNTPKTIYILFDNEKSPSIKDYEHTLRHNFQKEYFISGPEQNRPSDFGSELRNSHFKNAFLNFLIDHWSNEDAAKFIRDKEVYISYDKCYKYKCIGDIVTMAIIHELKCDGHDEADTKFAFFINKCNGPKNVVIQCSDTDILVIILGNMTHFDPALKIWLRFGTGNNMRYINATLLAEEMGSQACASLPAFHAFTGCDYNPSFYKKAKSKPFSLLMGNEEFKEAFGNIDEPANHKIIEKFVCQMYATKKNGLKSKDSVNDARHHLFTLNYAVQDDLEKFKKDLANFDACLLPPSSRELHQHISRTIYIASVWCNATLPTPSTLDPLLHGWKMTDNNTYTFNWFDGDEMPDIMEDVIIQPDTDAESETEVFHENNFEEDSAHLESESEDSNASCSEIESEADDEIPHENIEDSD